MNACVTVCFCQYIYSGIPPAGGSVVEHKPDMYTIYGIYNLEHNKIYIGQTVDLQRRLEQHNSGELKGYTSRFSGQWILVYSEAAKDRTSALVQERQLKS